MTNVGVRVVVGSETITSSGISKVDIGGEDGLKGVAKIDDNEITLNVVHRNRYSIKLTSDGYFTTKVYGPKRLIPFLKLSDQETDSEGFILVRDRLRAGNIYVHDVFAEIIRTMTDSLSEGQLECLKNKNHIGVATLTLQVANLLSLRSALLLSKESWQNRPPKSTKEELAELDMMVATAFHMDPK